MIADAILDCAALAILFSRISRVLDPQCWLQNEYAPYPSHKH